MPSSRLFSSVVRSGVPPASVSRAFHSSSARRIVHHIKTAQDFQKAVSENDAVLVECFASWCGPCKAIAPVVTKLSEEASFKDKIHFVKLDTDELDTVAQQLGVRAMPTFFFFRGGKKVDELIGAQPPALLEGLKKLAA
ncbi:Thioredoxin [Moelleriella libera RCEF 2490]|uniref:Thioredoxin n=1 Tax=Moelleriella libera RCEF 2490 TaxID=1081109 RepID=A0A168BJX5_9HYPO|nr:Thioredoxin [Moelleriella libera RCEF 2490]